MSINARAHGAPGHDGAAQPKRKQSAESVARATPRRGAHLAVSKRVASPVEDKHSRRKPLRSLQFNFIAEAPGALLLQLPRARLLEAPEWADSSSGRPSHQGPAYGAH